MELADRWCPAPGPAAEGNDFDSDRGARQRGGVRGRRRRHRHGHFEHGAGAGRRAHETVGPHQLLSMSHDWLRSAAGLTWLLHGRSAVGAPRPKWQELTPALVNTSLLYVDSYVSAGSESGDVILSAAQVYAEIGQVLNGTKAAQKDRRTIFKSLGIRPLTRF